uniref:ABC transmembrane type-1 domain-containing protein n=1 Tax=Strigamia maritima TaxID=126957 RepID=T1JIS1_STRMM
MAPAFSKLNNRNLALGCGSISVFLWLAYQARKKRTEKRNEDKIHYVIETKRKSKEKTQVDRIFFRNLLKILKIVIPGWFTPEVGYLILVAAALISRTFCDIWFIKNATLIETAIISKNWNNFMKHLLEYASFMPLIAIINNVMKYGLSEMSLRFRTRLSAHLYNQYLDGYTYYKMNNLDGRIANPDQLLTQDVEKFCTSLSMLYSNIMKPIADIIFYLHRLTKSIGFMGPAVLIAYLIFGGLTLNQVRKPITRMTVIEQTLEGEFRYVNSRLITNSEEIAFYQGNKREKVTLDLSFEKLINHIRKFIHFKFFMTFIDNMITKYLAMVVGYLIICQPFFNRSSRMHSETHDVRQQNYYTSGKLLLKLAESIGRLVTAGRELSRLAGFTVRMTELIQVLEDLQKGRYERTMVETDPTMEKLNGLLQPNKLIPGAGSVIIKNHVIHFDKVPLVTPNGDVLVNEMSFQVKSGMNVLVCGPNGCGKSSLFRILGELWPLFGGVLTKPDRRKLFYIPQRPYMTLGSLRDQVIYPDTVADQHDGKKIGDEVLMKFLGLVQLKYLVEREGGLDAVQDWMDVLSGGEKQRIAMARLFYHQPQFAILDECTSAVSVDVEGSMYQPELLYSRFPIASPYGNTTITTFDWMDKETMNSNRLKIPLASSDHSNNQICDYI